MKLKTILVDDEKHGRENLGGILREHCSAVEIVGEADSVKTAVLLINDQKPRFGFSGY